MEKRQKLSQITDTLGNIFRDGFEIYPFKIDWYNDVVGKPFQFSLEPDTVAFIVVSTPDMFEKALVPFLCREDCTGTLDPLDRCMQYFFQQSKSAFPDEEIETIHDFEMTPSRRPKILVQPAGHVAGAAYYYTRDRLESDPFDPEQRVCGVSIHPKFGGWFALRGVIIFKSFQYPDLPKKSPINCIQDNESVVRLLDLFNNHWQDWRFRDIIPSEKQYSADQKEFFNTLPKDRFDLIQKMKRRWLEGGGEKDGCEEIL